MPTNEIIIALTKKWITDVVAGCNFCPFVAREIKRGSIFYEVLPEAKEKEVLAHCIKLMQQLTNEPGIETTLLILPFGFTSFSKYLEVVHLAEEMVATGEYDGIYQLASFHPEYLFAGSSEEDPANYTNRSPYPMIHFLREESVSRAIDTHPDIESIPEQNISFTQAKGLHYMQELLASCM